MHWESCSATSARARCTPSRRFSARRTRTGCTRRRGNVYGVISLIFWAVVLVVTVTYILLVMRADNDGEGGIMALITLIRRHSMPSRRRTALVLAALGIFGASLFFGDSMITPAISVLSAIEGVQVVDAVGGRSRAAPHRDGPHPAVPAAAAGHRRGRAAIRAGDGCLVRGDRRVGHPRHRRQPVDPEGAVPHLRRRVPVRAFRHGVLLAGGRGAGRHRRRGPVRGHGALRPRADHPGVAVPGVPRLSSSTTWGRAPWSSAIPAARSATPSSCWCRAGGGFPW